MRTVYSIGFVPWPEESGQGISGMHVDVCGSGFLYNMVRILAGALLDVGTGRLALSAVEEALTAGNRELLGKTMPAKGLTLLSVDYGFPLFRR